MQDHLHFAPCGKAFKNWSGNSRDPQAEENLLQNMPKVAYWPNKLRWVMVFESDWMVPFIISTAPEISENAYHAFPCGACIYPHWLMH